jgi:hypothetical protein
MVKPLMMYSFATNIKIAFAFQAFCFFLLAGAAAYNLVSCQRLVRRAISSFSLYIGLIRMYITGRTIFLPF